MAQVGIVIRTYNEEAMLPRCLAAIRQQDFTDFNIVVVDSGSTDRTLDIVRDVPDVTVIEIEKGQFTYGLALNLGIQAIADRAKYAVCLSAHAIPKDSQWLEQLIKTMDHDDQIVGVYSRQIPLEEHLHNPLVRISVENVPKFFGDEPYVTSSNPRFSNVSSAIRISAWRKVSFDESARFGEDQIWSRRILEEGFQIAYQPRSVSYHSHDETFREFYRRILACEIEFRKRGFTESDRRFRRLVGRQLNASHEYLSGLIRSRKLRGSHWDIFRMELLSNWAWFRAKYSN